MNNYNKFDELRDIFIAGMFILLFVLIIRIGILEDELYELRDSYIESEDLQNEINSEIVKIIIVEI